MGSIPTAATATQQHSDPPDTAARRSAGAEQSDTDVQSYCAAVHAPSSGRGLWANSIHIDEANDIDSIEQSSFYSLRNYDERTPSILREVMFEPPQLTIEWGTLQSTKDIRPSHE